jgi:hypothetical protein
LLWALAVFAGQVMLPDTALVTHWVAAVESGGEYHAKEGDPVHGKMDGVAVVTGGQ